MADEEKLRNDRSSVASGHENVTDGPAKLKLCTHRHRTPMAKLKCEAKAWYKIQKLRSLQSRRYL